ncbi:chromate resistance protein [Paralcaligenes sp. KSB-10]|uniref:chromate resistance protein ChrB domain-containing protein n=1 Tax=Paralcaligenes sp. KSB-10 TaxID=2901142 RepID=UPI001E37C011|nr:chromate resistance protein ChrB domain-containing protein [Paralcaligenes sp. KSB-10]UHL65202.1 chromate resistance protein [Paralcaligenes sp. KSB-10]
MDTINMKWLLLIISLPTNSATARMRIWRALKALGCGALRDGVYLLPDNASHQRQLTELSDETLREGGSAWLLTVHAQTETEIDAYRALFDRSNDYAELLQAFSAARETLAALAPQEINRVLRKLRRDYEALCAIDYFPNEISLQTEAAWIDFVNAAELILSPNEPHAIDTSIPQLDPNRYQGRIWATRRHLWVDRVASAWLIRRFIDRKARFLWLDSPGDCPAKALGFDFDGATFTHIGDRVTFEVLLASFGLDSDLGLARLGAMVHALDVGNGYVPEANGFEAVLSGARQRATDDDQLLAELEVVLDSLYAHFSDDPQTPETKR